MNKSQWHNFRRVSFDAVKAGCALPINYPALQVYQNKLAMRATIETEIAPKLAEMKKASDILDLIGSAASGQSTRKGQGCAYDLTKYRAPETYGIGRQTEPDLAYENEPRYAMIAESAKLAEERNTVSNED